MSFTDIKEETEQSSFTDASKTTLTPKEAQPRFVVISAPVFSEEQCNEILGGAIPELWRDIKLFGNQKLAKGKMHKVYNDEKSNFPHAPIFEAFKTIDEQVFRVDTQGYHIHDYMVMQKYGKGDFYGLHQDLVAEMNTRKLTAVLTLSKPEDVEGGELSFLGIEDKPEFNQQGYIHIFPSFFAWEIKKVKKGEKKIITAFAHGEEYK
jgi:Rps23 Pro-64 3,4-dihydroxylase Tpa1-like proline 4-hydroxylase